MRAASPRIVHVEPFDLERMLWGEHTGALFLLEIVVRTIVMYAYAVVFGRAVGLRGVGGVSAFELILVVIIGAAAGNPMFRPDTPLLHGILVLTVIILLHRFIGVLTDYSTRVEHAVGGVPIVLVRDGEIVEDAIGSGSLSKDELRSKLRLHGIRDVGDVELALLEPSGDLSVFQASPERRRATESTYHGDGTD